MTRVLIRGGTVVDGSGQVATRADVAVENERVVAVEPGLSTGPADVIVDARDRVVAPGFIDIHTHYDAQVFWDPSLASSCFHGVTTVVSGNCGFSLAPLRRAERDVVLRMLRDLEDMPLETLSATVPLDVGSFAEYLDTVENCKPALNFASFVGHSTVRIAAMGPAAYERPASDDEIAAMCNIIDESIAGGAIGFATKTRPSTRPAPSQYASSKETESLLRVLSNRNQGVAMFNPGGAYDLERVYAAQHDNGRPFTWIALMAMPDGSHRAQLELHNAWTARGARVHPQVSCRPLVAQCTLALPSIFRAPGLTTLAGSSVADRLAAYRSPAWRQEFRRGQEWLVSARGDPWRDLMVISSASNASSVGRSIAAIAADENSDPVDVLFDLAVDDGLATTVQLTYGNGDEYEVSQLLGVEGAVLGLSDGGAHPAQSCDAVLPTDLLGPWVRDRKALTLERAVHKLTAEPAALLGFAHRGLIRTGAFADLVVFDPRTIGPGPVRMIGDLPGGGERLVADRPTGIDHVFVNGVAIRADGKTVESDNAPGRVLRSGG